MTVIWFDSTHYKRQPWKNGLGETLELYRLIDPHTPQDFLFRLSMARVETSGPFSLFPGIDRQLTLISGNELTFKRENGESTVLHPLKFISFPGEENIESVVSVPCLDFNIMTKRGWKLTAAKIIHLPKKGTLRLSRGSFLYQVRGDLKYERMLKSAETLWKIENDIEIESVSDSTSILIILT